MDNKYKLISIHYLYLFCTKPYCLEILSAIVFFIELLLKGKKIA